MLRMIKFWDTLNIEKDTFHDQIEIVYTHASKIRSPHQWKLVPYECVKIMWDLYLLGDKWMDDEQNSYTLRQILQAAELIVL